MKNSGCPRCAEETKIADASRGISDNPEFHNIKGMLVILVSAVLFIFGVIFRERLHDTPFMAAEFAVFVPAYILSGGGVLYSAAKNIRFGRVFDESFLMSISTLGAFAIHEIPEAVGVMLFYTIGEYLQSLAVNRSRASISALLEIRPQYANLQKEKSLVQVSPQKIRPGDIIVIKPGERVPLDGKILSGSSQVDTSALTGEPLPRFLEPGSMVLSGMINQTAVLEVKVEKSFDDSSLSKILDLVENASSQKAGTEKFITKFARYYSPIVVIGALGVAVVPPLLVEGAAFTDWIYRALVLLVISCPCALVISIPLGYFGGIGGASRSGILVKGANFLDVLSEVDTVVFDKTGTLTKGIFRVSKIIPRNKFNEDQLKELAALAELRSNHPIAQSIKDSFVGEIDGSAVKSYEEKPGMGVKAQIDHRTILAGSDRLLHDENIEHDRCNVEGTVVHVAVDGIYAGYLVIEDEIRDDARDIKPGLKHEGVGEVIMLTGDESSAAAAVASTLAFDSYHADLLPEEKVEMIEGLLSKPGRKGKIAFVGDGINDAPVIARADVGIAMGGLGSDAAIETADVVIMTDHPSKAAEAIRIGKNTKRIVRQNMLLALCVKAGFITAGLLGVATMWEAVFADVGVALLAVFNSTRALKKSTRPGAAAASDR